MSEGQGEREASNWKAKAVAVPTAGQADEVIRERRCGPIAHPWWCRVAHYPRKEKVRVTAWG